NVLFLFVISSTGVFWGEGLLLGTQENVKGTDKLVNVFLGIPFAKAPLGSLRFSPPEPPEPWTGLRDATSYPPLCPQDLSMLKTAEKNYKEKHLAFQTSEDCLYLSVYSPAGSSKKDKLPVMVWIHGGNFIFGGAARYDGSALSAYENVVVVIIQYRLGLLGFFNTGDEHARGNWAYLDQVAALRWVQGNIEHFGGDPASVTLFGISAGSCFVFVLSPLSKGLFHKAISESGACILYSCAKLNLCYSGCRYLNFLKLFFALRTFNVDILHDLKEKLEILLTTNLIGFFLFLQEISFLPLVLDGVFLHKPPEEILAGKEFNAVPLMIGVTNNEFGWNIRSVLEASSYMDTSVGTSILYSVSYPKILIPHPDEYLGDTEDPAELRDRFLDLLGDMAIVMPAIKALNYHRESGAPTYFFEFQHRPSAYWDSKPDYVKADHGDEVGFVFGGPFLAGDIQLRKHSLFPLAYRNPNGEGLVEWPSYNLNEEYLQINLQQKKDRKLKGKKVEFWKKVILEKTNNKSMPNKKFKLEL
uniref:Carboxylic ester hydrolase n=1 Tax=Cyanistes caeruleus TaxID=156563 RepID=A0A8C0Z876_CYACU